MSLTQHGLADAVNTLAAYLARRDLAEPTPRALQEAGGPKRADYLILLGNAIPETARIAAEAFRAGLAETLLISGGIGHSTPLLYRALEQSPYGSGIPTQGRPEADILADILLRWFGLPPEKVITENRSTNCGDNAARSADLLQRRGENCRTAVLIQDPTMQRRSHASFEKHFPAAKFWSFAPFLPRVDAALHLTNQNIDGLWEDSRFYELIGGEIPRLRDDEKGYGPKGRGFIVHVDIPAPVEEADLLLHRYWDCLPHTGRRF